MTEARRRPAAAELGIETRTPPAADAAHRPRKAARRDARPWVLRLDYRPPYDFGAMLDFLRGRALPGIEQVDATSYARIIAAAPAPAWLRLDAWPRRAHALRLELHGVRPVDRADRVAQVRRMFDLDADPAGFSVALARDSLLRSLLRRYPGLRLPGGWDGFEIAVRAVLGQQVSVAAARTLAMRLAQRHGARLATPIGPGLTHGFPAPAALADADLTQIGLTRTRAATVRTMAQALLEARVGFRGCDTLDEFVALWTGLPGIGPWTANYIALRALRHPDAFPTGDLVLRRVAANGATPLSAQALAARAEAWRPWRAYAAILLWRAASDAAPAR